MRLLAVLLALSLRQALAQDWRNPDAPFNAHSNAKTRVTVSWLVSSNVQHSCETESRRRGLGGFGYGVDACSFWDATHCTIVTSTRPTMHQLGHELRHCFQGNFH